MIQEKLQEHKIKSNHEILQETLKEMTTASCAQEYNLETAMASARKVLENSPKVVETGFVKGLDLCRAYFNEVCYPLLEREFANFLPRMAAGLIGEGSECYGFDDEISRDHDFGPSFQIYIPKEDMPVYGERLKHRLATLPKTFQGFGARVESQYGVAELVYLPSKIFIGSLLRQREYQTLFLIGGRFRRMPFLP